MPATDFQARQLAEDIAFDLAHADDTCSNCGANITCDNVVLTGSTVDVGCSSCIPESEW